MRCIFLDFNDYFSLTRAVVCAEIKRLRGVCDVFGMESRLSAESGVGHLPAGSTDLSVSVSQADSPVCSPGEVSEIAARVIEFFGLEFSRAAELAELATLGQWVGYLMERLGPRPKVIAFRTSGSTGEPKSIVRDYYSLERDALYLAELLPGTERVLGLVPPHHIYGFIHTVLIPKALGAGGEDLRFHAPAAVIRGLRSGDVVMGFPHIWRLLAEIGEFFPAGVTGMTSTGPCPPEIIRTLKGLGLQEMIEIYGSSESGAIGHRSSPDDPLTLMGAWQRRGSDRFFRELEGGGSSEPFTFQDVLEWVDETRFFVRKRLDSAVQVAGINVYPARVREALLAHAAVADCAVRLMRPEEGSRLKAFVVLKDGFGAGPGMREHLRDHLAAWLTRIEQPGSIMFGRELPRNEMGKPADWTMETVRPSAKPSPA